MVIEHLFVCFFSICKRSLVKYIFKSFAHFTTGLFIFPFSDLRIFYIFWIQDLYQIHDLQRFFSQFLVCLVISLTVEEHKFFILIKSILSIFTFMVCAFGFVLAYSTLKENLSYVFF